MPYDPPTLSELQERVGRDIRDPEHMTLGLDVLSDFINDGIVELNQIKPPEARLEITDVANLEGLPLNYVYRVDLWATDGYGQETIPPTNEAVRWQSGWSYWAHELTFSQATRRLIDQGFTDGKLAVIVWGYTDRDPLVAVDDVFEGDLEDEQLLRRYCKSLGFAALMADRNLFQQWQIQANNTDVSATQLNNMAQTADSEWQRVKKRAYVIRRPAAAF